jgi:ABC-type branched-subunit amino acid transport system permease subunit
MLPGLLGGFWTYSVGVCMANAVAVLSVGFLLRFGGEVSIGHSFFLALGAYCTAVMERELGVSLLVSLPVAAAAGAVLGLGFAWPSRALSGIYLAIATMALALAVPELILQLGPIAGGYEGLYVSRPVVPGLSIDLQRYYLPLLVLGLVVVLLARFRRSRQGLVLLTARDHPRAAEAFGFSRGYARLAAFAISATVASIAGALLAFAASTVSPNSFTLVDVHLPARGNRGQLRLARPRRGAGGRRLHHPHPPALRGLGRLGADRLWRRAARRRHPRPPSGGGARGAPAPPRGSEARCLTSRNSSSTTSRWPSAAIRC